MCVSLSLAILSAVSIFFFLLSVTCFLVTAKFMYEQAFTNVLPLLSTPTYELGRDGLIRICQD